MIDNIFIAAAIFAILLAAVLGYLFPTSRVPPPPPEANLGKKKKK